MKWLPLTLLLTGCATITEEQKYAAADCWEQTKNCKCLDPIKESVEERFVYVAEPPGEDVWQKAQDGEIFGDCEDYAANIRHQLNLYGIKNNMIYGYTRQVPHVAVAVEHCIVDNRYPRTRDRSMLNYEWTHIWTIHGWEKING